MPGKCQIGFVQPLRQHVAISYRPPDAADRIAGDGIAFAQIIEQRRELAPDAGGGEVAGLEVLAPGDDLSAGDDTQLDGPRRPAEVLNSSTSIL